MAAALASAPQDSGARVPPATYEAEFAPLRGSERDYAVNGPVGPFYPQIAVDRRIGGEVTLECRVGEAGTLERCIVVAEAPAGYALGAAARIMAQRKRIVASTAPLGETIWVRTPFTPRWRVRAAP